MNAMNKLILFGLSAILVVAPISYAEAAAKECVIEGTASDWRIEKNDADVFDLITAGQKPVAAGFWLDSDNGQYGETYVVFDLPRFKAPVLFGKLRIQIEFATTDGPTELPINLWDISDLELLEQPLWTFEEYFAAKADVSSGREYGNFSVDAPDVDEPSMDNGRIFEVPLSYDAMYDIDAAAGGKFAIGIANGDGWSGEFDLVDFLTPVEGGVLELVIPYCQAK